VKVVLNPAPAQKLDAQVLKQVDYLVVNETEASLLSDVSVTDLPSAQAAATVLQQLGAGVVIVTLGAMGIWVADTDQAYSLPAFQVKVVDTTAAGDTFVGSFAVAIAEGMDLRAACMFAQSAAALAVTQLGAQTSIPYRGAVERQLQSL
jgi:ribokinase